MDLFACKSDSERKDVLREAANQMDMAEIVLEKDFWVCWTLNRLFLNPELSPYLTFKGGTSLSKGYDAIARFSEDVDITICREAPYLRDGKDPLEVDISNKERKRRIDALVNNAQRFVQDVLLPHMKRDVAEALNTIDGWDIIVDENDKQTLLFYYPRVFSYGQGFGTGLYGTGQYGEGQTGYIKPHIKLEFGARGDIEPNEKREIKPYVADVFPDFFENALCPVSMLSAERTFWEKATILHSLYHGVRLRDRMSRHYYDTFMLKEKGIADNAIKVPALLEQVVFNKSLMFKDNKASYDTAVIGSLKLLPKEEQIPILEDDYKKMQEMFMEPPPEFNEILEGLSILEKTIADR